MKVSISRTKIGIVLALPMFMALMTKFSVLACANPQKSPNLLFILTDDQRDNTFSGMGHPWVETPQIDKLLSKSVRFENAYIAEPSCTPSRAALLLGCHERVNQLGFCSAHKMTMEQWKDSYPALLHDAGYETGYVGKWHVKTAGFKFDSLFDYSQGHEGHGAFFFKHINPDGTEKMVTTNRHHTNNALKFIRKKRGNQPFCLSLCYASPHGSKVVRMHKPLDRPASENELLKNHSIYGGKYRDLDIVYPLQKQENPYDHIPQMVMHQDSGRSKLYRYDYNPIMNKEHHFRYYQMITEIDQMVGELVAELEKQGLAENTIIIFGSDHGLLMGEYGMGGKTLLYDLVSKFPCFIYDPTTPEKMKGLSRSELVSSIDITVTMMDYAGVEPGPYMMGRSLRPLVQEENQKSPWRKGLFLENMYTGKDNPLQEGYVDSKWKYIRFIKVPNPYSSEDVEMEGRKPDYEMLFSLVDDPEESLNKTNDPKLKGRLNSLRNNVDRELKQLLMKRKSYRDYYNIEYE